jgi:cytochrome oxidase Cu insertion factor (SCO1/SenC/PrrC family)
MIRRAACKIELFSTMRHIGTDSRQHAVIIFPFFKKCNTKCPDNNYILRQPRDRA